MRKKWSHEQTWDASVSLKLTYGISPTRGLLQGNWEAFSRQEVSIKPWSATATLSKAVTQVSM